MDVAILKHDRSCTKNKIGCAFDVAIFIVLPAACPKTEKHILKPNKPAIEKRELIATRKYGHGLPRGEARIVFKRDVLCFEMSCINKKTGRCPGVHGIAIRK